MDDYVRRSHFEQQFDIYIRCVKLALNYARFVVIRIFDFFDFDEKTDFLVN